jgi:hypothetical protein
MASSGLVIKQSSDIVTCHSTLLAICSPCSPVNVHGEKMHRPEGWAALAG